MPVVTDANLVLGRLRAQDFPSIFGETNDQPLDVEATRTAFEALTAEINTFLEAQAAEQGTAGKTMTAAQVGQLWTARVGRVLEGRVQWGRSRGYLGQPFSRR